MRLFIAMVLGLPTFSEYYVQSINKMQLSSSAIHILFLRVALTFTTQRPR